ncbi:MAG TPA: hypothetical protein VJR92_16140 [Gemmatimonadaceae bacterium]|nr:hypothetical protein [Gemmatimonadaceae bacterium]
MVITPATAFADAKPGQQFCPTYKQVESTATGGQYVGGILLYETMGTVTRIQPSQTTTVSVSSETELGVPQVVSSGATTTVSVATTGPSGSVTTEEPIGFYQMNDGTVYQINCLTGDAHKV